MILHIHKKHLKWQALELAAMLGIACGIASIWLGAQAAMIFTAVFLCTTLYTLLEHRVEKKHIRTAKVRHHHILALPESRQTVLWCGLLIGGLAVGNFLFFFVRHGVNIAQVPVTAPIYTEATALAGLTVLLCILAHLLHHRLHLSLHLELPRIRKQRLLLGYAGVTLCMLLFVYVALRIATQPLQMLTKTDWSFALLAAGVFVVVREFQRYDRKHHRKALHSLHREIQNSPAVQ